MLIIKLKKSQKWYILLIEKLYKKFQKQIKSKIISIFQSKNK